MAADSPAKPADQLKDKFLIDPYLNWAEGEGIPIHLDFGHDGGRQIEYQDQDPRAHRKWLDAIAENGVSSLMGDVFDEDAIRGLAPGELTGVIKTPRSTGPAV